MAVDTSLIVESPKIHGRQTGTGPDRVAQRCCGALPRFETSA
ncbi:MULTISPECIES: hypothetical protein [unclassified Rhizobium]|nr:MULTISPECIES: hypothetical protein [unclassified Rhizobium]